MVPKYLATVEIDQRQKIIFQAEKLREMLGASRQIAHVLKIEEDIRAHHPGIEPVMRVSGVLRYVAESDKDLFGFLAALRRQIGLELAMPVSFAIVPCVAGELDVTNTRLETELRARKDARSTVVDPPFSPLFAQCRIISDLPANRWQPEIRQTDDLRRKLLSSSAAAREEFSDKTRTHTFMRFRQVAELSQSGVKRWQEQLPFDFKDLVAGEADSYIAMLKADGDGLGRLLLELTFDGLAKALGLAPHEAAMKFSDAIEECLENALTRSVNTLTATWKARAIDGKFPVVPLVRAGEDFWILTTRDLALRLAGELVKNYAQLAKEHPVLNTALQASGLEGKECLTLSVGVLFAKQGYPFDAQIHLAEELVRSAKAKRKALPEGQKQGCIDFHWLASSGRESLSQERESTLTVQDDQRYLLTQRPFTASDLEIFRAAALRLGPIPRGKLHELGTILRMGDELASLRFCHWKNQLTIAQWQGLRKALDGLPEGFRQSLPWSPHAEGLVTPLLDLVELADIGEPATAGHRTPVAEGEEPQ